MGIMTVDNPKSSWLNTSPQVDRLQRKCACGKHTGYGGECEGCKKKRLQQRATNQAEPTKVPPSVHETLLSPGQPLEPAIRTFMETRFGQDFSRVRIHTDKRAGESAQTMNALAYTVGRNIVFGQGQYQPSSQEGKGLLAHELAHVCQQQDSQRVEAASLKAHENEGLAEHEADQAAKTVLSGAPFRPTVQGSGIQRKKFPGKVLNGNYELTISPASPNGHGGYDPDPLGRQEQVEIRFSPDAGGPKTDRITFIQAAQTTHMGKIRPWGPLHPGEEAVDQLRTTRQHGVHRTVQGETLRKIAIAHYGTDAQASDLLKWNPGVPNLPNDLDAPLPADLILTIPNAVMEGYSIDINPKDKKPRTESKDPSISPEYPHLKAVPANGTSEINGLTLRTGGGTGLREQSGRNPSNGKPEDAAMEDFPGGGPLNGKFRFETSAFASDLGLFYGAVQWGFDYDPFPPKGTPSCTNEDASFNPNPSDTFRTAMVKFTQHYRNRHQIKQGETLRSISLSYYKDSHHAFAIYKLNPGILPSFNPDSPLPGGKELDLPTVWDTVRFGAGGVTPVPEEKDTIWDKMKRLAPTNS